MNAKSQDTPAWTDPDDAPELTEEMLAKGVWRIGEKIVPRAQGQAAARAQLRRGRPPQDTHKVATTIRLSPEVLDRFRADGPGWQTRIDAALKDYIAAHPKP